MITSGKLQDIETNIECLKKEKRFSYLFHKFSLPFCWKLTREEWIKLLEFEANQEREKLEFESKLNKSWDNLLK